MLSIVLSPDRSAVKIIEQSPIDKLGKTKANASMIVKEHTRITDEPQERWIGFGYLHFCG